MGVGEGWECLATSTAAESKQCESISHKLIGKHQLSWMRGGIFAFYFLLFFFSCGWTERKLQCNIMLCKIKITIMHCKNTGKPSPELWS